MRPVLAEHCYKCHSAQAKSLKGGLRLDSFDGMRRGGDTGPAVVPGDLEASLLVEGGQYDDDVLRMPPKGKLPDASIATLTQWVKEGAVVPHAAETALGEEAAGPRLRIGPLALGLPADPRALDPRGPPARTGRALRSIRSCWPRSRRRDWPRRRRLIAGP